MRILDEYASCITVVSISIYSFRLIQINLNNKLHQLK